MSARAASARNDAPPAAIAAEPPAPAPLALVPAPSAPVAPPAPTRRRRSAPLARPSRTAWSWLKPLLLATLFLALLGGAAAAAWIAFSNRAEPAPAARDRAVAVGAASVTVPAGWAPTRIADARVPGLDESAAVFALVPGLSAYAVVALGARGVPSALDELVGPLGRARPTTLAGVPALAYGPHPVADDRVAQLTVARTSAGTLAVACLAPSGAWTGVAGCAEQVLAAGAAPGA